MKTMMINDPVPGGSVSGPAEPEGKWSALGTGATHDDRGAGAIAFCRRVALAGAEMLDQQHDNII